MLTWCCWFLFKSTMLTRSVPSLKSQISFWSPGFLGAENTWGISRDREGSLFISSEGKSNASPWTSAFPRLAASFPGRESWYLTTNDFFFPYLLETMKRSFNLLLKNFFSILGKGKFSLLFSFSWSILVRKIEQRRNRTPQFSRRTLHFLSLLKSSNPTN